MVGKVNEIKLSYKGGINLVNAPTIKDSSDAAKLLFEYWDNQTIEVAESFKVVMLNNANKVKGIYHMSEGGITGTLVDIRILFAIILKSLSTGIILAHNHPSGNLKPSKSDIELTKKIKNGTKVFDISLLDHIILIPGGDYYSFADNHKI